ncbi:NB-ARC domain-containing protein [Rivularia sp. PCC 7116]|uniref:NB-ARC domain-containing protein n=1 Tax=Rivularia sp. PCC 7116 TaxID=373994 RepID=UPI0002E73960|nr:NB-ARC domain-containing protein [Rivularia sp. PCC 7116]
MHSEEISKIADEVVFSFASKHLTDLQVDLLKASCKNQTYEEFAESFGYSSDYVKKNIGSQLWKLLSLALGEKVSKKNFRQALERYHQTYRVLQFQETQKLRDWGAAPDASLFFGREKELTTLKQWIVKDRCRLVGIVGINGVGKTHLSVKLAKGIQDEFDYLIWRSLRNAPAFEDILYDFISFLSNQQENKLNKGINAQLRQLIRYLRENRSLLILDNVESILQVTGYREGYEDDGELFRQIGECSHNSCLLFTSREKPKNIQRFNKIKPVRFLELRGLDYVEGRKIFNAIADFYASEEEWKTIIEFYDGNPLALELAAHHINEVFCGNISRFLIYGKQVFGDIHELLDWHFQRLSGNEQEVMFWLAINTEAVTLWELTEDILSEDAKEQVIITLQSLKNKIPLEISQIEGEASFGLQHVLVEYTINKLIEHICSEIKSGEISLLNQYALLKASAKCYERETQIRLIVKPIIQKLSYQFENKNNLIIQLNKIISKLKTEFYLKPGYATGNIINLLCHLQVNLTGYDFSNLTYQMDLESCYKSRW